MSIKTINIGGKNLPWNYNPDNRGLISSKEISPEVLIAKKLATLPSPFAKSDVNLPQERIDLHDGFGQLYQRLGGSLVTLTEWKNVELEKKINNYYKDEAFKKEIDEVYQQLQAAIDHGLSFGTNNYVTIQCTKWVLAIGLKTGRAKEAGELLNRVGRKFSKEKFYEDVEGLFGFAYTKSVERSLEFRGGMVEHVKAAMIEKQVFIDEETQPRDGAVSIADEIITRLGLPGDHLDTLPNIKKYLNEWLQENAIGSVRPGIEKLLKSPACLGHISNAIRKYRLEHKDDAKILEGMESFMTWIENFCVSIAANRQGEVDMQARLVPCGMAAFVNPGQKIGVENLNEEVAFILRNKTTGQVDVLVVDGTVNTEDISTRINQMMQLNAPSSYKDYEATVIGGRNGAENLNRLNPVFNNIAKVLTACANNKIEIVAAQILDEHQPAAFVMEVEENGLDFKKARPGVKPVYAESYAYLQHLNLGQDQMTQVAFSGEDGYNSFILTSEMIERFNEERAVNRDLEASLLIEQEHNPFGAALMMASKRNFMKLLIAEVSTVLALYEKVINEAGIRDVNTGNAAINTLLFREMEDEVKSRMINPKLSEGMVGINHDKVIELYKKLPHVAYPYAIGGNAAAFNELLAVALINCIDWDKEEGRFTVNPDRLEFDSDLQDAVHNYRISDKTKGILRDTDRLRSTSYAHCFSSKVTGGLVQRGP